MEPISKYMSFRCSTTVEIGSFNLALLRICRQKNIRAFTTGTGREQRWDLETDEYMFSRNDNVIHVIITWKTR